MRLFLIILGLEAEKTANNSNDKRAVVNILSDLKSNEQIKKNFNLLTK
jgi:hypothetical protein